MFFSFFSILSIIGISWWFRKKFYTLGNFDLLFSAVVEFNSVQDAIDGYNDPRYQEALALLGENKEDVVVRNLVIIEAP